MNFYIQVHKEPAHMVTDIKVLIHVRQGSSTVPAGNERSACGGSEHVGIDRGKRGMMLTHIDTGVTYYSLLSGHSGATIRST